MRELGTPLEHPTWVSLASPVELPDPLATYPPILFPTFNKEEYATLPAEGEDGNAIGAQGNELAGVEGIVDNGVKDEGENLPKGYLI